MIPAGKLKISIYLAGIFLTGAIAGGILTYGVVRSRSLPRVTTADFSERHFNHIVEVLQMTPEQVKAVKPIVAEVTEKMRVARRDSILNFDALVRDMNARIEPLLTPEQKAKLKEMQKSRKERIDRYIGGMPSSHHDRSFGHRPGDSNGRPPPDSNSSPPDHGNGAPGGAPPPDMGTKPQPDSGTVIPPSNEPATPTVNKADA